MYVPRRVWSWVHTISWAKCSTWDASHSRGAEGRCWSVHLCGQQPCWDGYWFGQPEGWRWVYISVFPRSRHYVQIVHKVRFSPPLTEAPLFSETPADLMAKIGENVTLHCSARGSPQPTVSWHRHDGRQILTGSHSRMVQLESGHLLIQGEFFIKHYHSRAWHTTQFVAGPFCFWLIWWKYQWKWKLLLKLFLFHGLCVVSLCHGETVFFVLLSCLVITIANPFKIRIESWPTNSLWGHYRQVLAGW